MESQKTPELDQKTAKLIEEMEKSLRNMEQSLGMDHLLVAKILDSYAQLLRQNNLRHLDALNMEARAKAIRAKHNQKEAEEQDLGIDSGAQSRSISTAQAKALAWGIAAILLLAIGSGLMEIVKWSNKQKDKPKVVIKQDLTVDSPDLRQTEPPQLDEGSRTLLEDTVTKAIKDEQEKEKSQFAAQQEAARSKELSQYQEKSQRLRNFAKEQLRIGQDYESNQDLVKASDAYFSVIKELEKNAPLPATAACEEMAQCFEGYGRIAEINARTDLAAQCQKNAAEIRQLAAASN